MEELESQDITTGKISTEYTTETLDETTSDYLADYDYGQTQDKLEPGIEVNCLKIGHTHSGGDDGEQIDYSNILNTSTVSRFFEKDDTWESAYSAGTFKITTGFRPKYIRITAIKSGTLSSAVSYGECYIDDDDNATTVTTYYDDSANNENMTTSSIIFVKPFSASTSASIGTRYDDGFNLVFPNNNWNISVKIYAEG